MKGNRAIFCMGLIFQAFLTLAQGPITQVRDFGSNPGNLGFFMHEPAHAKPGAKLPLVVALHGCNEDVNMLATNSDWDMLADKYDFYVIYPSQKFLNNPSSCFNWYNKGDAFKDQGEALSIRQMILYMRDSFNIDTTRIFAYGLSAGAAMACALLADYPYLFKAGAVLAGAPFSTYTDPVDAISVMMNSKQKTAAEWAALVREQNPDYTGFYPKLIVAHGKKDNVVNIRNSYELIKQWSVLLHTDTVPSRIVKDFANNKDVEKKIYEDNRKEEKIIFYEISNIGHVLAVDPGSGPTQGGHTGIFAVDKDFFSTYWIAKDFGLVR